MSGCPIVSLQEGNEYDWLSSTHLTLRTKVNLQKKSSLHCLNYSSCWIWKKIGYQTFEKNKLLKKIGYKTHSSIYWKTWLQITEKYSPLLRLKKGLWGLKALETAHLTDFCWQRDPHRYCGFHAGTTQAVSTESVSLRRLVVGEARSPLWRGAR